MTWTWLLLTVLAVWVLGGGAIAAVITTAAARSADRDYERGWLDGHAAAEHALAPVIDDLSGGGRARRRPPPRSGA